MMKPLIAFLKNNLNIKKDHLPASFWPTVSKYGAVVNFSDAFVKDFPVLQVGLQDAKDRKTFRYYDISPQTYLLKVAPHRRYLGFTYPAEKGANYAILGNVFLANYYTEYYLANNKNWARNAKVGFGSMKGLCQ